MEAKIIQEKLSKALNLVSKVCGGRTTLPILNNVLLRVDNEMLNLVTTNLDMAVVAKLPATGCKNGAVTVPARLIAEFVGNLPKGETVEMKTEGNKTTITAKEYTSSMNGAPADDFPELPQIDESKMTRIKIPADVFKDGLGQVMIAASNDTSRPSLTGIFFNSYEGGLYVAATDGYRLAERKLLDKTDVEVAAIVPAASLRMALGLLDDASEIEILIDEVQVKFILGEMELTSKLVDGSFPDYRQLIPKNLEVEVKLDRGDLVRVTKLAALFAREVGGSVICTADKEKHSFAIQAVANELGENVSEITTEVQADGKVTLNSRFLLDVLNVMDGEDVQFSFSNKLDPVVLRDENDPNYTHIIMPLKS